MKTYITLLFALTFFVQRIVGQQKELINYKTGTVWPGINSPGITNDDKYFMYTIRNQPIGNNTLVVVSRDGKWEKELVSYKSGEFTNNNKNLIVSNNDTIKIIQLGTDSVDIIPNILTYKISKGFKIQWLAYQTKNAPRQLVIRNLIDKSEIRSDEIKGYQFIGDKILLQHLVSRDQISNIELQIEDLISSNVTTIWAGEGFENIVQNRMNDRFVFLVNDKTIPGNRSILYFKAGMDKAEVIYKSDSILSTKHMYLNEIMRFSNDDSRIFVRFNEETPKPGDDFVNVDVWSYKDFDVQPRQLLNLSPKSYWYVLWVDSSKLVEIGAADLQNDVSIIGDQDQNDDWGLLYSRGRLSSGLGQDSQYLVLTKDGSRISLPGFPYLGDLSPDGKYMVYFDPEKDCYSSYEMANAKTKNITTDIPLSWKEREGGDADIFSRDNLRGIAGWVMNENAVLIYDQYDIWKLDISGMAKPVNLTNGYGRRNNTILTLVSDAEGKQLRTHKKDQLLLSAFNSTNKNNGFFYLKSTGGGSDPILLTMDAFHYGYPIENVTKHAFCFSSKSNDSRIYVVQRMNAFEFPNYFWTRDFRKFIPISHIHPEKKYNWFTTELHCWTSPGGKKLQGVLYKPENFDPNKKYPVIFYFYRKKSDNLNVFLKPECTGCIIDIPTYASNGYLVFTPDIYFTLGKTGESALGAVLSAADYLVKLPYVNPEKMGIDGCSFSGFTTNYIVTHSNRFTAACSASGLSDLISGYNSVNDGTLKQPQFEEGGPYQIGGTLWDNADAYIKNSPVFFADRVTTPLLIMQTTNDETVPLSNAVEFFTALRRLGKKTWMLQYGKGDHQLKEEEYEDFAMRALQFFDYYLKDAPPPKWMTEGIPAALKGIKKGLEIDFSGKQP